MHHVKNAKNFLKLNKKNIEFSISSMHYPSTIRKRKYKINTCVQGCLMILPSF